MTNRIDEAAARARWLTEVAAALDEAQRLATHLSRWRAGTSDAATLQTHIMAVRDEVEALRRARIAPKWSKRALPRPDQTH